MRRILVSGASTWIGGQVVAMLERWVGTEVFGIDELPPRHGFRSPFILLGPDRAALADHILALDPDTVVHLLTVDRAPQLGPDDARDRAIVGNQALFGAAGRSPTVRRVVVKSDAAVYPLGPRSPSVFTETDATSSKLGRFGRLILDVETAAAALASRSPDTAVTVLRMGPIFGRTVENPISRYLRLPVVPTLLGYDPRLHLLHEGDAVAAVLAAVDGNGGGTFNVAAAGPMYLSRIIRLGRRLPKPLPRRALAAAHSALARAGFPLPAHIALMLEHGAVLDTRAMQRRLGFTPEYSVRDAVLAGYAGRVADD
ncbi:MAG: NAD-dependent epimerase/dehydratase family protein [Acidimicrobiia bacterium]